MGAADSKLAFRQSVFRLFNDRHIPMSEEVYWNQFWQLPESADDIFSLLPGADIRKIRDEAPENFKTLLLLV